MYIESNHHKDGPAGYNNLRIQLSGYILKLHWAAILLQEGKGLYANETTSSYHLLIFDYVGRPSFI